MQLLVPNKSLLLLTETLKMFLLTMLLCHCGIANSGEIRQVSFSADGSWL